MTSRVVIFLSMLWATLILALGAWWLYLILTYGEKIQKLSQMMDVDAEGINIIRMVTWEGLTFLVLLVLLSSTLLFLYLKDQRKTKALTAFFAGLTHELKTPLASIRLQTDVLSETINGIIVDSQKREQLSRLTTRLNDDTLKLENQMDKILQLSRIERGGNLSPIAVNLTELIKQTHRKWGDKLDLNIQVNTSDKSPQVMADEFALELVLRNLFENTLQHADSNQADVEIGPSPTDQRINLTYSDGGQFSGRPEKVGELFYKHNSSKGSGIGLYLVKKLMEKMGGEIDISTSPSVVITLSFEPEVRSHSDE